MNSHAHRPSPTGKAIALAALAAGLALGAAAGCEERVVEARGLGADGYQIQEPMYEQPGWERAIMGDNRPQKRDVIVRQE